MKGQAWNDNFETFMDFTGVFIDGNGIWHGTVKATPTVSQSNSLWLNWADESKETGLVPTSYWIESDEENPFADGFAATKTSYAKLSSIGMLNFAGVLIPWDAGKLQSACDPAIADCDSDTYLIDSDPPKNDCSAFDASSFPQASETICADGADNDCDGATDAADSDCGTPTDDDGDGYTPDLPTEKYDCEDDPVAKPKAESINSGAPEICDDLLDNDCDFKTDGEDPECEEPPEDLTPDPTSDDYDFLPPVIRGGGAGGGGTAKGGLKIGYTGIGGGNRAELRETIVRNYAALKREKGEAAACPGNVRDLSSTQSDYQVFGSKENIFYCKGDLYIRQTGLTESWTDSKTIIIEDGNIFVVPEGDPFKLYTFGLYPNATDKTSQLGIIVLRTDSDMSKGNVYISGNVRYMRTNIYSDGSVYSLDSTGCNKANDCGNVIGSDGVPILKRINYSAQDSGFSDLSLGPLQQQLVIEGTVSSNNVLGGSDPKNPSGTRSDFTYLRSTYCPRPATITGFSAEFPELPCVIEPVLLEQLNLFGSTYITDYTYWWNSQTGDTKTKLDNITAKWSEWIKNRAAPKGLVEEKLRNPGVYFIYHTAPQDLPIFSGSGKSGTTQKRF